VTVVTSRNARLLNHLIRAHQQGLRNCEAERLRGFQIEDERELCRLLNGEIPGFGALENLVNVFGGERVMSRQDGSIRNEATATDEFSPDIVAVGSLRRSRAPVRYSGR